MPGDVGGEGEFSISDEASKMDFVAAFVLNGSVTAISNAATTAIFGITIAHFGAQLTSLNQRRILS